MYGMILQHIAKLDNANSGVAAEPDLDPDRLDEVEALRTRLLPLPDHQFLR
jgi:hypothetical protein